MDPTAYPRREAAQIGAELGNLAFLTPFPSERRRAVAEEPAQPTRPDLADTSEEGDREDIGSFEQKIVFRLY